MISHQRALVFDGPNTYKEKNNQKFIPAKKFVDQKSGRKGHESWSIEGMNLFNYLCKQVKQLRSDPLTGTRFEDEILEHYK